MWVQPQPLNIGREKVILNTVQNILNQCLCGLTLSFRARQETANDSESEVSPKFEMIQKAHSLF